MPKTKKDRALWVVQRSIDGLAGPWDFSIFDVGWYRVAETRREAEAMAAKAREATKTFGPILFRYRVRRYTASALKERG